MVNSLFEFHVENTVFVSNRYVKRQTVVAVAATDDRWGRGELMAAPVAAPVHMTTATRPVMSFHTTIIRGPIPYSHALAINLYMRIPYSVKWCLQPFYSSHNHQFNIELSSNDCLRCKFSHLFLSLFIYLIIISLYYHLSFQYYKLCDSNHIGKIVNESR